MHSKYFKIEKGVRQGDVISPTLFNIFINDISNIFTNENSMPPKLVNSSLGNLLFADDLLILSESAAGLQHSLDSLSEYCDKWQLSVNIKKTKTMKIQNRHIRAEKPFIKYKNEYIHNVKEYKFLGSIISDNGSLVNCSIDLSKKARKALFAIRAYTSNFEQVPVKVACNIFETLVRPILTFNSEICFMDTYLKLYRAKVRANKSNSEVDTLGFIDKSCIEKINLNFIKFILGTRRCATNWVVREELGIPPIESFIKSQTIQYLARLNNDNINPILKEAYELSKLLDRDGTYSWYTYATNVAEESNTDLNRILNCKTSKQTKNLKREIKDNVNEYFKKLNKDKLNKLNEENKNFLYKFLNIGNDNRFYLTHPNKIYRKNISKFRVSDHNLLIETGRYKKIPREQRLCSVCKILDDECHFFFKCKINQKIKEELFSYY